MNHKLSCELEEIAAIFLLLFFAVIGIVVVSQIRINQTIEVEYEPWVMAEFDKIEAWNKQNKE